MTTDTKHTNVWTAFVAAQSEFKAPAQSGANPHFNSRYSTLGDIFAATLAALHRHGLVFTQIPVIREDGAYLLSEIVWAENGQSIESLLPLDMSGTPQQFGSRLSYLKRYAAAAMFAVVDGMDDDGEAASAAPAPRKASAPQPAQKTQQRPTVAPTQADEEIFEQPEVGDGILSDATHKRLHIVGEHLYGDAWDAKRHELVTAITKGAESSSSNLTEDEAMQLIKGMEKLLRERAQQKAKQAVAK